MSRREDERREKEAADRDAHIQSMVDMLGSDWARNVFQNGAGGPVLLIGAIDERFKRIEDAAADFRAKGGYIPGPASLAVPSDGQPLLTAEMVRQIVRAELAAMRISVTPAGGLAQIVADEIRRNNGGAR